MTSSIQLSSPPLLIQISHSSVYTAFMMFTNAKTRSHSISISLPTLPRLRAYRSASQTIVAHVSRRRHSPASNRSLPVVQLRNAAFVLPLDRFSLALRQISRTLQFWPRVVLIWGSFKLTQISVALQRKYRKDGWERSMWDKRHSSAGDVCRILIFY